MFEPSIPERRNGMLYDAWASYWYRHFDNKNEGQEINIDYMQRRTLYMQERWQDAMRKKHGVQNSENLPKLENYG